MGIGTRDEETGEYFKSEGLENGHWYEGPERYLYIVPDERYGGEEIAGPDDDITEKLNKAYREGDFDAIDPDVLAKELGLEVILPVLRRFDPEIGFYHA